MRRPDLSFLCETHRGSYSAPESDLLSEVYVRLDEGEECVLIRTCSTVRALLNLWIAKHRKVRRSKRRGFIHMYAV